MEDIQPLLTKLAHLFVLNEIETIKRITRTHNHQFIHDFIPGTYFQHMFKNQNVYNLYYKILLHVTAPADTPQDQIRNTIASKLQQNIILKEQIVNNRIHRDFFGNRRNNQHVHYHIDENNIELMKFYYSLSEGYELRLLQFLFQIINTRAISIPLHHRKYRSSIHSHLIQLYSTNARYNIINNIKSRCIRYIKALVEEHFEANPNHFEGFRSKLKKDQKFNCQSFKLYTS